MVQPPWNTFEIRWFCKEPHRGLRQFFDQRTPGQATLEERTDDYLLTGREDIGVKFREGRLEIKTRNTIPGPRRIGILEGVLEEWTKRGFMPPDGAFSHGDSGWVSVCKRRWATLYSPSENGAEYQPLSDTVPKGVQLEYTELNIGRDLWYTVALEWPSQVDIPVAGLPFVRVLEDGNLDPELSMGYPMFLKGIAGQEAY